MLLIFFLLARPACRWMALAFSTCRIDMLPAVNILCSFSWHSNSTASVSIRVRQVRRSFTLSVPWNAPTGQTGRHALQFVQSSLFSVGGVPLVIAFDGQISQQSSHFEKRSWL